MSLVRLRKAAEPRRCSWHQEVRIAGPGRAGPGRAGAGRPADPTEDLG
jgi:hypothetical protein